MIITKKVTYSISMNIQVYLFLSPSIMVSEKGELLNWFYRLNTDIEDIT